jgi:addiction module RelE/StbE family toxin
MSYRILIHPDLASTCRRLRARDPARYEHLKKKIRLLVENPEMGKPLHPPFTGLWRVHVGHFVLVYGIQKDAIVLLRFAHHDDVYT